MASLYEEQLKRVFPKLNFQDENGDGCSRAWDSALERAPKEWWR